MDFFENIDALLWRLAAILALVLVLVATLVVRLLLRDRGRSDRQQKLRVQQTLKGSGLDRKSTRLNSSHVKRSRMPSSA